MRGLLLALVFVAAPPVDAAAGHLPKNNVANVDIAPVIVAQQQPPVSPSLTVALILPVNAGGITGRVAAAFYAECRNWQKEQGENEKAAFSLYATDGKVRAVVNAYRAAAKNNVDIIVGPLLRENAAALTRQITEAKVPTLLLQPAKLAGGDNYYFLTLEAGREAAELAELIHNADSREVLVVVQESELALRQLRAFAGRWRQMSGTIPRIFRPADDGWAALFERQKDAAESERRVVVFAAGDAAFVRRVRHFTPSYHPVFGGGFVYDGAAFADGIYMMAMPHLLMPPKDDDDSAGDSTLVRRYRALGFDACAIAAQAGAGLWADGFEYDGKSGAIVLDGGEFRRRGVLARLHNGKLQKAPKVLGR